MKAIKFPFKIVPLNESVCSKEDVTNEIKDRGDHDDWSGPIQFVKELKDSKDWEVFNLFNFGIIKNKPSSTGLTLIRRK